MGKIKKYNILNIKILLLLKPMADMLWNISVFDYFIMLYAIIILIIQYKKLIVKVKKIDIFITIALILLMFSFVNEINGTTIRTLFKLASPFILYFIGRNTTEKTEELMIYMCGGYLIAFFVDFIALVMGKGFVLWGHALTFTGFYFFKTDLGVALLWVMFLLIFNNRLLKKRKICSLFVIALSIYMIVLSNSRMTLILTLFLLVISCFYYYELKTGHLFKIELKLVLVGLIVVICGIYFVRILGQTAFFAENGFIAFEFEKLSDLYSPANLQGRDAIWKYLLEKFNSESLIKRVFGVSLNSYIGGDTYLSGLSSHNIFIGILYSFGYFGLILFGFFICFLIARLNKECDRQVFYLTLFSMSLLIIYGISVNTHEFTNYTWNFAFTIGYLYNDYRKTVESSKGKIKVATKNTPTL